MSVAGIQERCKGDGEMNKRILFVCLVDPAEGKKGDAKLLIERRRRLESMGHEVDILFFKTTMLKGGRVVIRDRGEAKGIDIEFSVCLARILRRLGLIQRLVSLPLQTWMSFLLWEAYEGKIGYLVSSYRVVHFYHLRSVGLWKSVSQGTKTVVDVIDSYTLNLASRISLEKNVVLRYLLRKELKRIEILERNISDYVLNKARTTLITVCKEDLSYFGCDKIEGCVVPVGIEMDDSIAVVETGYPELRCVFFGNLNYEPNINACRVLIEIAKLVRKSEYGKKISFSVGGRSVGRRLRYSLERAGIKVVSPVMNMKDFVSEHNVAVLPMVSGSGMQSKTLEAAAWNCLIVSTRKAAKPLGMVSSMDYIEANSAYEYAEVLIGVLRGYYPIGMIKKNALERIEGFRWKVTCETLSGLYD